MLAICRSTSALAPVPMLTPTITAAMPTISPSMVRNERRILRRIARNAVLKIASILALNQLHGPLLFVQFFQCLGRVEPVRDWRVRSD